MRGKWLAVVAVGALLVAGCAGHKELVGEQTYYTLEPVKELDIDQALLPVNLIVRVHNVADAEKSYKNRFELKVNGKKIVPVTPVTNVQSEYEYHLKLKPGYYKVEGKYYASGGWEEEVAEAKTRDLVRIEPNRRTVLDLTIRKNWDGTPVDKVMYFNVSYEPLTPEAPQPEKAAGQVEPVAKPSGRKAATKRGVLREQPVMLQINTDPEHCDVIVDDQNVGQSPLRVWVDSGTSHVIQVSHEGYKTAIRYLDSKKLRGKDKITIIERLEPAK
ncbi:MAG: PEGA domain-containing protein [Calditrichaeota bacterium]|nr:PEGA domain-containing protein [Calditrichota bacterium]